LTITSLPIRPITIAASQHRGRTAGAHNIFDRIQQQITQLSSSRELDLFTDTIALEALSAIELKYTALHEAHGIPNHLMRGKPS
jgi:hypothetical protein